MQQFIIVSDTISRVTNPFVTAVSKDMPKNGSDKFFLIHTAELAASMFDSFSFTSSKIYDNVFWFEEPEDVNRIISEYISGRADYRTLVAYHHDEIDFGVGDVFYYRSGDSVFFLIENVVKLNINVANHLSGEDMTVEDIVDIPFKKFIGFDDVKCTLKQLGYIDDYYVEKNFIEFLRKYNIESFLLLFYRDVYSRRGEFKYSLDGKYNDPHMNILLVEKMLSAVEFNDIDLAKVEELGLKFDSLPARFDYHGFYTTTGRIYCTSENYTSLQNLSKDKLCILNAEQGSNLIEFDYKTFEYDILCQIIGYPMTEDPHSEIYDRLVGLELPNKRDVGKKINYAFLYGMNELRMADMLINEFKIGEDGFRDSFVEKLRSEKIFNLVKDFDAELKSDLHYGVIDNYFGRNIHCKKEYAVLSNYISSTAADLVYYKMLNIADMMVHRKDKILLEKHDSILIQLSDESVESGLFERIHAYLQEPVNGIKGRIGYNYGKNWGNMI